MASVDEHRFTGGAGIPPPNDDGSDAPPRSYGRPLAEPPVMQSAVDSSHLGFIALAAGAGLFDFLATPILDRGDDGPAILLIIAGILLGQLGAMTFWLVWSEGTFIRRLAIHWGVAVALVACVLVGMIIAIPMPPGYHPVDVWELIMPFLVLPLVSLGVQIPLWPLRTHFGWRVQEDGLEPARERPKALSILDILCGTSVVALSLGMARAAVMSAPGLYVMVLAMWVVAAVCVSMVILLPAVTFVLRSKEAPIGIAMLFGYAILTAIICMVVAAAATGDGPPGEVIFALLLGCFAFTASMAAPLFVWRACGYRLVWPRDRR